MSYQRKQYGYEESEELHKIQEHVFGYEKLPTTNCYSMNDFSDCQRQRQGLQVWDCIKETPVLVFKSFKTKYQ